MNKWYKKQIDKMLEKINDELFLKRIYIIVQKHLERRA